MKGPCAKDDFISNLLHHQVENNTLDRCPYFPVEKELKPEEGIPQLPSPPPILVSPASPSLEECPLFPASCNSPHSFSLA